MNTQHIQWRKSRHSDPNGHCVEVGRAAAGRIIAVRDTKQDGHGPVLEFTQDEWAAFLSHVRRNFP